MPGSSLTSRAGVDRLSDPGNFPGLTQRGGKNADKYENNVVKIYQLSLASAITAAAAKSGAAR